MEPAAEPAPRGRPAKPAGSAVWTAVNLNVVTTAAEIPVVNVRMAMSAATIPVAPWIVRERNAALTAAVVNAGTAGLIQPGVIGIAAAILAGPIAEIRPAETRTAVEEPATVAAE